MKNPSINAMMSSRAIPSPRWHFPLSISIKAVTASGSFVVVVVVVLGVLGVVALASSELESRCRRAGAIAWRREKLFRAR